MGWLYRKERVVWTRENADRGWGRRGCCSGVIKIVAIWIKDGDMRNANEINEVVDEVGEGRVNGVAGNDDMKLRCGVKRVVCVVFLGWSKSSFFWTAVFENGQKLILKLVIYLLKKKNAKLDETHWVSGVRYKVDRWHQCRGWKQRRIEWRWLEE